MKGLLHTTTFHLFKPGTLLQQLAAHHLLLRQKSDCHVSSSGADTVKTLHQQPLPLLTIMGCSSLHLSPLQASLTGGSWMILCTMQMLPSAGGSVVECRMGVHGWPMRHLSPSVMVLITAPGTSFYDKLQQAHT
jgi:hypothetical protein